MQTSGTKYYLTRIAYTECDLSPSPIAIFNDLGEAAKSCEATLKYYRHIFGDEICCQVLEYTIGSRMDDADKVMYSERLSV
jgi:hypothetical protein